MGGMAGGRLGMDVASMGAKMRQVRDDAVSGGGKGVAGGGVTGSGPGGLKKRSIPLVVSDTVIGGAVLARGEYV